MSPKTPVLPIFAFVENFWLKFWFWTIANLFNRKSLFCLVSLIYPNHLIWNEATIESRKIFVNLEAMGKMYSFFTPWKPWVNKVGRLGSIGLLRLFCSEKWGENEVFIDESHFTVQSERCVDTIAPWGRGLGWGHCEHARSAPTLALPQRANVSTHLSLRIVKCDSSVKTSFSPHFSEQNNLSSQTLPERLTSFTSFLMSNEVNKINEVDFIGGIRYYWGCFVCVNEVKMRFLLTNPAPRCQAKVV